MLAKVALYSSYLSATALVASLLLSWTRLSAGLLPEGASAPAGARFGLGQGELRAGRRARKRDPGQVAIWVALAALSVSLLTRTVAAGRPPYGSQYEFALAFAWGILVAYAALTRGRRVRGLAPIVLALALGLLVYASTMLSAILPPVPALQNNLLLGLHVGAAILAYGANAVAFAAAGLFLLQRWLRSRRGRYSALLPDVRTLDELGYRAVMVGFPMLAAVLLLGSWWASIAWGYYWNWDPKETATLATWVIYAIYLHTRVTREWQGEASAVLLLLGFAATLFTFAGNLFFQSLHSYSGL